METTFPRILATTALCLAAVSVAPLHAEDKLSFLQQEQAQRVIDIYRHTPELRAEYESRCYWVFVPMLYHEISTDSYLSIHQSLQMKAITSPIFTPSGNKNAGNAQF